MTTVKLAALGLESKLPLAADVVLRGSMVDDNLSSVMTVHEAKAVVDGLQEIYGSVGMHIHKWSSSHAEVLSDLDPEDLSSSVSFQDLIGDEESGVTKALGVVWDTMADSFSYQYEAPTIKLFTQRSLLKLYMTIFDPLGWVGPFIILARMLYRDTCALRLGWDTPIPDDLAGRWSSWFRQLPHLSQVQIPRWSGMNRGEFGCMHVFSDASSDGYGACAYWASGPLAQAHECTLLASRGKVNSSDARSIPQLELMGAVVGLELAKSLCKALDLDLELVYFWVDAENTLYRVLAPSSKMERFVARRVAMLREQTNLYNWRWIGTHQNPADALSRGLGVGKLLEHELWWHGPMFLTSGEPWPALKITPSPHVELEGEEELLRLVGIYTAREPEQCPFERHSKFLKNCRIMRVVIRFAHKLGQCKQFEDSLGGAKKALMRWEQVKHWSYEVGLLENGGDLPLRHEWQRLVCSLREGLVMVETRAEGKQLVLLPDKSFLTRQWLFHLHENELHHVGGHRSLLASSRKIAWVRHGIAESKSIVWNCVTCRRRQPTPITQRMGPLPNFRVFPKDGVPVAFATAGLDVAGPFFTKQGRGKACLLYTSDAADE